MSKQSCSLVFGRQQQKNQLLTLLKIPGTLNQSPRSSALSTTNNIVQEKQSFIKYQPVIGQEGRVQETIRCAGGKITNSYVCISGQEDPQFDILAAGLKHWFKRMNRIRRWEQGPAGNKSGSTAPVYKLQN